MKRKPQFVRSKQTSKDSFPSIRPVVGILLERTLAHADKVLFPLLSIAQQGFPFLTMNYGRTDMIRNKMAIKLLESNFTHLVMLDVDHMHPVDIVQRLMMDFVQNPTVRVVGGLNFRRGEPYDPCAFIRVADGRLLPMTSWPEGLVRVDALGTGCIAIAREVFEQIEPPWFYNNYDLKLIWRDIWQGEDMGFATKCEAAGIEQYVDTRITSPHVIDAMVNADAYREYLAAKKLEDTPLSEAAPDYVDALADSKADESVLMNTMEAKREEDHS